MEKAKAAAARQGERLRDLGAAITPKAGSIPKFWKRKASGEPAADAEASPGDQGHGSGSGAYYPDSGQQHEGGFFGEHGEDAEAQSGQVCQLTQGPAQICLSWQACSVRWPPVPACTQCANTGVVHLFGAVLDRRITLRVC